MVGVYDESVVNPRIDILYRYPRVRRFIGYANCLQGESFMCSEYEQMLPDNLEYVGSIDPMYEQLSVSQ
jgi:hypothetical protein